MLETKSKTIGDHDYKVTQLGAGKGRKVLVRLLKTCGPAFALAAQGNPTEALGKLASDLDEETLDYLVEAFAARTELDGIGLAGIMELHFAANYGEMLEWLGFCIQLNYSSFLSALAKKAPKADALATDSK